mgnify:CR=1 FL=1
MVSVLAAQRVRAIKTEGGRKNLENQYAIEMLNITKKFPGIIANDNITLQLKKGEIHALLGENGAGKSTLMSVLFGLYQPEEGIIKKDGKVVLPEDEISSPTSADALAGFIECLMHNREFGLYHASCDGSCSRAEWAREILRLNGMDNIPVVSAAENTELRPRFTLLDNMMLRITGLYQMPDWKTALADYFKTRQGGARK